MIPLVTAVWEDSGRAYGARRVTCALVRAGRRVACCAVERLVGGLGMEGVIRGQRRRIT
ncbi:IS3 family transposase, partial [Streptomyces sp. MAR4 CNY-716]